MVEQSEPILILGGTGHYGRWIVRCLVGMGRRVRVLSRDREAARRIIGDGPEIIVGDVTSKGSVTEALQGVSAIVESLSALSPKLIRKFRLIERDSVLMVLEEAEKRSIWTVLGAAPSMELFFALIRGERMMVPGGGPPALPTVSPRDVGEIAAQVVVREDLGGRRIRVTGPEALSFPEAARRISAVTGRPLKVRKIPLWPFYIASVVTRPVTPFVRYLVGALKLLNGFPQDLVAQVPQDHHWLVTTFDYTPTTLEMETRWRVEQQDGQGCLAEATGHPFFTLDCR